MRSGRCKCGQPSLPYSGYCRWHKNEQTRKWRQANGGNTLILRGEARKRANARSYLKVYIRRGKIVPQVCEVCSGFPTQGHHDDYDKPLDARWFCEKHHLNWHGKKSHRDA